MLSNQKDWSDSYKTNQNDWKEIDNKYSTQKNNYIDLKTIELAEEEYITDCTLILQTAAHAAVLSAYATMPTGYTVQILSGLTMSRPLMR